MWFESEICADKLLLLLLSVCIILTTGEQATHNPKKILKIIIGLHSNHKVCCNSRLLYCLLGDSKTSY